MNSAQTKEMQQRAMEDAVGWQVNRMMLSQFFYIIEDHLPRQWYYK